MKKNKILEYYEGNPDNIVDNGKNYEKIADYNDDDAIAFGYFPVNIYGSYEFMSDYCVHMGLAQKGCIKLLGKARYHVSDDYFHFLLNQCYDKSYGMGRYWEDSKLLSFWYIPSSKYVKEVALKLNISMDTFIVIKENDAEENVTVGEYIKGNWPSEEDIDDIKSTPFRIDPKIKDIIERYNETEKSWQVQKEKSGWDTIAQRNAMIYQEGKERIDEYYTGDPDTIYRFDDETCDEIESIHFRDPGVLSFGFFQTEIGGEKEFIYAIDKGHHDMATECAKKYIGKAYDKIGRDEKITVGAYIYANAAFKGRIFLNHHVITSWSDFSSKTLADILSRLEGGVEKYKDWIYLTDWSNENIVSKYISLNAPGDEEYEIGRMKTPVETTLPSELIETIKEYNTPESSWAAEKEKSGWKSLAQRNAMIYQEGKETINEYFGGNPDTLTRYDYSKRDSGLLGKIGGFINKLTNKKGFTPQHIRQEYYYDEGNTITFGYFQDSIDGQKIFKKTENGTHLDIARACTESYVRNAKSRIGRDGYDKVREAIVITSVCKGRVFLKPKVLTTWGVVTSAKLKEIVGLLEIENPQEYYYVVNRKEYNLLEYINSNHSESSGDGDENRFDIKIEDINDRKLQKYLLIIKDYNSPSSKLVDKSRKLGKMTIAQYNSLIHQENKKSKQTIKENMENKGYKKEFSNYLQIMSEALNKKDFAVYDAAKEMLEETVEDCKHEKQLAEQLNTTNFGILNHIFEERLPELFKTNKKAVRDVIKTIREDKNLIGEFNYYNAIRQYKGKIAEKISPDMIMSKLNEAIVATINKSTVIESNKKFRKVLKENNIIPNDFVDDEMKELYESGHNILTKNSGSINNVMVIAESSDNIKSYMDKHKTDAVKEAIDPDKLVKEYKEKLKDTLTESEMSFVQQITDWRSPIAEQRKEKLFNKFKNECIDKINEMLKEDKDNVELKGLSDQINEMSFNKDTIVKDIAKLLEIRDILLDE